MIVEGVCDHCARTLIPEINRTTLKRSTVVYCAHCDRTHQRQGCQVCDVMFRSGATADLEEGP